MTMSTLFKNVTRVIVFSVLVYAAWQVYLFKYGVAYNQDKEHIKKVVQSAIFKEEIVTVPINGVDVSMTKSNYDLLMQRQLDISKKLKSQEAALEDPSSIPKRLEALDTKTKKDFDTKITNIEQAYNDFINDKDEIFRLLSGLNKIERQPGESPREFQSRKEQSLISPVMMEYKLSNVIRYANKTKDLDILSLNVHQKTIMLNSCSEMMAKQCEQEGGFFVYECIKSKKSSCSSKYFNKSRVGSNLRHNSYGPEFNSVFEAIDILGDINKVDYAGDGYTSLMRASAKNDIQRVESLINLGANIDFTTADSGESALMVAVKNEQLNVVSFLIKTGANLNVKNSKGETALFYASGNPDILELLVTNGADIESRNNQGQTVLFYVLKPSSYKDDFSKHRKGLEYLIANDVSLEVKDNKGLTPFLYAVATSDLDLITLILNAGADLNAVNDEGKNALYFVARNKTTRIFSAEVNSSEYSNKNYAYVMTDYLINQGVNIDRQNDYGDTPLMTAVFYENAGAVDALLANNADVNIVKDDSVIGPKCALQKAKTDAFALKIINHPRFDVSLKHNQQPLGNFIDHSMNAAAEALIAKGADVNAPSYNNLTPLMYAVMMGNDQYVQRLLSLGADKSIISTKGYTALSLAKRRGYHDIINMLE